MRFLAITSPEQSSSPSSDVFHATHSTGPVLSALGTTTMHFLNVQVLYGASYFSSLVDAIQKYLEIFIGICWKFGAVHIQATQALHG